MAYKDKEKDIRKAMHYTCIYHDHFKNDYPTIIYCGRIQKWKKLEMIPIILEHLTIRKDM